mgnify:CR=1 FL=1
MTDPIADFLTRLRNAYLARQSSTIVPYSKLKAELAGLLLSAGYITKVDVVSADSTQKSLKLKLKYQGKYPILTGAERLSKPGRRLYAGFTQVKPVLSGQGLTFLSTSQGLMTGTQARKARVGGELLCKIW